MDSDTYACDTHVEATLAVGLSRSLSYEVY
jgi:hypothetical protein